MCIFFTIDAKVFYSQLIYGPEWSVISELFVLEAYERYLSITSSGCCCIPAGQNPVDFFLDMKAQHGLSEAAEESVGYMP